MQHEYGYTNFSNDLLSPKTFGQWCWFQLAIVFIIASYIVKFSEDWPSFWLKIGLVVAVPALVLAYYIAKANDSVITSALAVVVGAAAYGVLGGVNNTITVNLDVERVFDVCSFFAIACALIESIQPGILARRPIWTLAPALCAPIVYFLAVGHFGLNRWDPALYSFIVISAILEYVRAWQSTHTLDNAIDFSVEFVVYLTSFFAKRKRD